MSKRGYGEKCTYCTRTLESVLSRSRVAATRDHYVPRAHGGMDTVWCCRQCNELKKDMLPEDWRAFMEAFPEWWKHPEFARFGTSHKRQRGQPVQPARPLPYAEAWREAKASGQIPAIVPLAYPDDPKAQAAFAAVYGTRLHLLRSECGRGPVPSSLAAGASQLDLS